MRFLLVALLCALSYAQTEQVWTGSSISEALDKACTFSNGHIVQSGWTGKGFGDENCNSCACNNGILMCTLMICPTTTTNSPTDCVLEGGEAVHNGWSGKDTGNNSCNNCMCAKGDLMCTKKACIIHPVEKSVEIQSSKQVTAAATQTSTTTSAVQTFHHSTKFSFLPQVNVQPAVPPSVLEPELPLTPDTFAAVDVLPSPSPGVDFRKLDKTTCGGDTQGSCHDKLIPQCFADPCCKFVSGKCQSVAKVVPVGVGLECGDLLEGACRQNAVCLWSEIEKECDELKEMDCQDLHSQKQCRHAEMCSWVLGEAGFSCRETKEVESHHVGLMPNSPVRGRLEQAHLHGESTQNASIQESYSVGFLFAIAFVGLVLGCAFGILIARFPRNGKNPSDDLREGMIARQI